MSDLKLREYQTEAIQALFDAWAGGMQRPAVVLPTGMGKTVIFAKLITELLEQAKRTLVLVHRDELAKQTVRKIHSIDAGLKAGVVKAERDEHGPGYDVVVASVQTLGRPNRLARIDPSRFDVVIIDEAHHAAAESYRRVLDHFGCFAINPDTCSDRRPHPAHTFGGSSATAGVWTSECPGRTGAVAAGFTATMARGDSKALSEVWDEVVYTRDVLYGIVNGYLVNPRGRQVPVEGLDLSKVKKSRGDFQDKDLGDALIEAGAPAAAALGYWEHATRPDGTVRPGILFAPSVASAHDFADAFTVAGIPAEVVTGDTPAEERALIYKRFEVGETKLISSCMVLTEGFDAPWAEVAVIARPTQMGHLYVQMVGRVLRPWPLGGKREALVLDIVGISTVHKLASMIDLLPKQEKPIVIKDGETIGDAIKREKAKIHWLKGQDITGEAIDLFTRSTSAWLTTAGGFWFIPTKSGYFFLERGTEPGTWLIGKTSDQYRLRGASSHRYAPGDDIYPQTWGWLRNDMDLEIAMSVAEELAATLDPSVSSRKSSWRRKSEQASDAQKALLVRYGIEHVEDIGKSAASDLLAIHFASRCIDRRKKAGA